MCGGNQEAEGGGCGYTYLGGSRQDASGPPLPPGTLNPKPSPPHTHTLLHYPPPTPKP